MTAGDWEADLRRADAALANWRHDAADFRSIAECVADAVAAERERVLAPIRAILDELEDAGANLRDLDPVDRLIVGANRAAVFHVRQAITQAAAPAASPADQPGRKP